MHLYVYYEYDFTKKTFKSSTVNISMKAGNNLSYICTLFSSQGQSCMYMYVCNLHGISIFVKKNINYQLYKCAVIENAVMEKSNSYTKFLPTITKLAVSSKTSRPHSSIVLYATICEHNVRLRKFLSDQVINEDQ